MQKQKDEIEQEGEPGFHVFGDKSHVHGVEEHRPEPMVSEYHKDAELNEPFGELEHKSHSGMQHPGHHAHEVEPGVVCHVGEEALDTGVLGRSLKGKKYDDNLAEPGFEVLPD